MTAIGKVHAETQTDENRGSESLKKRDIKIVKKGKWEMRCMAILICCL